MKFSEYIVLEKPGGSVDPLGFLRPSSMITDGLFRQFTVLSNHPTYHGLLCFLYRYLEEKGIVPGQSEFSRRFRDMEALWGILNVTAGKSILNVTKLAPIAQKEGVTLADVRKYAPLYARLHYGTLGHYSTPSSYWGLLNRRRTQLTELGRKLANTWNRRKNVDFEVLLDGWWEGRSVMGDTLFKRAADLFNIDAEPSEEERRVWTDVIDSHCAANSVVRPLWDSPLTEKTLNLSGCEDTYPGFFPAVKNHYGAFPDLVSRLELAEKFETLAGCTQFVFEWEYCKRLEEAKKHLRAEPSIESVVEQILPDMASQYLKMPSVQQPRDLFVSILGKRDYEEISLCILDHHAAHQRSKGAMAFMNEHDVTVKDRVDFRSFVGFLERVKESPELWIRKTGWRYRRDWHFGRAIRWNSYAGRNG